MKDPILDSQNVVSRLFFPRSAPMGDNSNPRLQDGTLPVEDDIVVGYRLYLHEKSSPLIVFFHGNGEIATDYNFIAPMYLNIGVSLLVFDYRGYGWSTGSPLTSALATDAEKIHAALPELLKKYDVTHQNIFLMGRSLGSASAVHLARHTDNFYRGLIIESGFAETPSLLIRLGIARKVMAAIKDESGPIGNARKMAKTSIPLLVIHGKRDNLLPAKNAKDLYEACQAEDKTLMIVPGAGHNDLLSVARKEYFETIKAFIDRNKL